MGCGPGERGLDARRRCRAGRDRHRGSGHARLRRGPGHHLRCAAGSWSALDVRDGLAVGEGWRDGAPGVPVELALARLADAGVTTFEVTAIARDGDAGGPDLELLTPLGGVGPGPASSPRAASRSIDDLLAVRSIGCAARSSAGRSTTAASTSPRRSRPWRRGLTSHAHRLGRRRVAFVRITNPCGAKDHSGLIPGQGPAVGPELSTIRVWSDAGSLERRLNLLYHHPGW